MGAPTAISNETTTVESVMQTPESPEAATASGSYDAATTVATVGELRKKAPKVWRAILHSIAQTICFDMRKHGERMKKAMKQRDY